MAIEQTVFSEPKAAKKVIGECPYCKVAVKDLTTEFNEAKKDADAYEPELDRQRQSYRDKGETVPNLKNPKRIEQNELGAKLEQMKKSFLTDESGRKLHCQGCGKMWDRSAIGKPYSIELERGEDWVKEQELKRLRG